MTTDRLTGEKAYKFITFKFACTWASQRDMNTHVSGAMGVFMDRLTRRKGGRKRPLRGGQMVFRKDNWVGDKIVCDVCLGVVLTCQLLTCEKSPSSLLGEAAAERI